MRRPGTLKHTACNIRYPKLFSVRRALRRVALEPLARTFTLSDTRPRSIVMAKKAAKKKATKKKASKKKAAKK